MEHILCLCLSFDEAMDIKEMMSSEGQGVVSMPEESVDAVIVQGEAIFEGKSSSTKLLSENLEELAVSPNDDSLKDSEITDIPSDPRVQVLRKRIPQELNGLLSDADTIRFLRARNYNIDKATEMIEKWGKWWFTPLPGTEMLPKDAASGVDPNEEVYRELMPHSNLGETKSGCPIYWEKTGQISSVFHLVKKALTEDDIFVRHIRQQEVMVRRLKNASLRHESQIDKQVIVMDMRNVVMTPDFMATRVFHRTVVIDEACYPERLHTLFMINAPYTFSILWALIKPWIDPVTVEKFKILGSNYQDVLKEQIADDQIPVEYGGTWEDFGWTFPDNISDADRLKEPVITDDATPTVTEESSADSVSTEPVVEPTDSADPNEVLDAETTQSVEISVSA